MFYIPFQPIQRLCLPAFLLRLAAVEVVFSVIDKFCMGIQKSLIEWTPPFNENI